MDPPWEGFGQLDKLQNEGTKNSEWIWSIINNHQVHGEVKIYSEFSMGAQIANPYKADIGMFGRMDLVVDIGDQHCIVVDLKTTTHTDEQLLETYWKQLNAYRYILMHPEKGQPWHVSGMYLVPFSITSEYFVPGNEREDAAQFVSFTPRILQVPERSEELEELIKERIELVYSKEMPRPLDGCKECENYRLRAHLYRKYKDANS